MLLASIRATGRRVRASIRDDIPSAPAAMVECFGAGRTRTSNSYLQFILKPPRKNAIFSEVLVRIGGTNAPVRNFCLKEMLYFCLIAGLLCGRAKSLIVPGSIRHFENIYKIVCHN
jgi:hypothetical protein